MSPTSSATRIAYQGEPGANSHLACTEAFPEAQAVAYPTFEDALAAVKNGDTHYAMIPIENSVAGRVADIHHLLPGSNLYIVGEHFLRVRHQLMGIKGTDIKTIKKALSHTQALGQCRRTLRDLGITPVPEADTAGSARLVSEQRDPTLAAIASKLAAEIYGLEILRSDIEDEAHNTTRFIVLAKDPDDAEPEDGPGHHHVPVPGAQRAGRALQGARRVRDQRRQHDEAGELSARRHIQRHHVPRRHPRPPGRADRCNLALEELSFFSTELRILGTYLASPYREESGPRRGTADGRQR